MKYTQYEIFTADPVERDWLVSILADYGFEGFEETMTSLKAFIPNNLIPEKGIPAILEENDFRDMQFEATEIAETNWNEEWEKNFEPVTIADKVGIRAPFHAALNTPFEIVIEPKMSFGTGHHATTALMVELMLDMDLDNLSVLDFGSGTGVLAIMAEKLKAAKIVAIDNEEWAYKNCIENTERNGCVNIECLHGDDTYVFAEKFDVILANINRNVILANAGSWAKLLQPKGKMLVSGILLSDEADIIAEAAKHGLLKQEVRKNNGWISILFSL